jgi:hypothetical protein
LSDDVVVAVIVGVVVIGGHFVIVGQHFLYCIASTQLDYRGGSSDRSSLEESVGTQPPD